MRMKVICGDEDCREEFFVESKEHIWVCPNCAREIENRNYPFLTAKLMQAKIDGDNADWRTRFEEIIEEASKLVEEIKDDKDPSFIEAARSELEKDMTNARWRELHDRFLEEAREFILNLEK